jgi:hypothetical protein
MQVASRGPSRRHVHSRQGRANKAPPTRRKTGRLAETVHVIKENFSISSVATKQRNLGLHCAAVMGKICNGCRATRMMSEEVEVFATAYWSSLIMSKSERDLSASKLMVHS